MSPSQLAAAFDAIRQYSTVQDVTTGSFLDLANKAFAKARINSSGGKTVKLPNDGFIVLIHNYTGAGTITVNDSDGNAVASVIDNETAFCVRVGEATNDRWHAVVLKMGAT